jgi:hypothetical protein
VSSAEDSVIVTCNTTVVPQNTDILIGTTESKSEITPEKIEKLARGISQKQYKILKRPEAESSEPASRGKAGNGDDPQMTNVVMELSQLHGPNRQRQNSRQLDLPVIIETTDDNRRFPIKALVDSGCTGSTIDRKFVEENGINTQLMPKPVPVFNADGTRNAAGDITRFVEVRLSVSDHHEKILLAVAELGRSKLFIGHEWLAQHNPSIDWTAGSVSMDRCPEQCDFPKMDELDPWNHEDELVRYIRGISKSNELASAAIKNKRETTFEEGALDWLKPYQDIFSKEEFDKLPPRRSCDHAIELLPEFKASDCKIYPLTGDEEKSLDEFLEENLRSGRIRKSNSPMASPFFFVGKSDGNLRPVQDYRKLNNGTKKNKYPLPLISDVIDSLRGAQKFCKYDVRWGYNNIRIKEGDEWKAAFRTKRGLFEPTVMFFGLCNSPATFQAYMDEIFGDMIRARTVAIYMDDIFVPDRGNKEEYIMANQEVMRRLRKENLYLKWSKTYIDAEEIPVLGVLISKNGIRMDPIKVAAIIEWPVPKNKKDVQQFLGFCNFYRRFIQGYSEAAKPLNGLTGKTDWTWEEKQDHAFQAVKNSIANNVTLLVLSDHGVFRVEADSSDYANGGTLSQLGNDGKWRPVAFRSKSLSPAEQNYEIYDKELLAIVQALEDWRQYLLGAQHKFEIWTDHENLSYFRKPQKINRRQARWITELANYDFELVHKPGTQMKKVDILSRRIDYKPDGTDNEDVVVLKGEWFRKIEFSTVNEPDLDNIIKEIKEKTKNKEKIDKVVSEVPVSDNGFIIYEDLIYIPKDEELRSRIITLHHDPAIAGHPGMWKTTEQITWNYWWPGLRREVKRYIKSCEACQRTKARRTAPHGPLNPNEVPEERWTHVTTDLVGPLPESGGYDAAQVWVDQLTGMVRFAPTQITVTGEGSARLYRDHIFRSHGLARKMFSDRGPQFRSAFTRELSRLLGIEQNISTAHHPQTDGKSERMIQELEQYLRLYVQENQKDWWEWLPMAEFVYNNTIHTSTGVSPFYANYGYHPNSGQAVTMVSNIESAEEFAKRMEYVKTECQAALQHSKTLMKKFFDRHRNPAIEYSSGSKVWLESVNLQTGRPSRKLSDKRVGPFEVVEKVGRAAYRLKVPNHWKAHPVFNEVLLTPYTPPEFPTQRIENRPLPELVEGVDVRTLEGLSRLGCLGCAIEAEVVQRLS